MRYSLFPLHIVRVNLNKKMPAKRHKVVERPKTRKELRKDKRTQKKANRVHFHKRKKELRIEYRARLKQKNGKGKRNEKSKEDVEEQVEEDPVNEHDDDEIPSDFELSDEEMEAKMSARRYELKILYIADQRMNSKNYLISVQRNRNPWNWISFNETVNAKSKNKNRWKKK